MTSIIGIGLLAVIGVALKVIEVDKENERKAKEAEGWIKC